MSSMKLDKVGAVVAQCVFLDRSYTWQVVASLALFEPTSTRLSYAIHVLARAQLKFAAQAGFGRNMKSEASLKRRLKRS
jgi:hypothetical protein